MVVVVTERLENAKVLMMVEEKAGQERPNLEKTRTKVEGKQGLCIPRH